MTQAQTIARHIVKYGEITRNQSIGLYRITRLAAVVKQLAEKGVPIISEAIKDNGRVVDWRYTYRTDYLERIRGLAKAQELLERYSWPKKAR